MVHGPALLSRASQVCDEKARMLTNDQRSAVADFFSVSKGNEHVGKKVRRSILARGCSF